MFAVVMQLFCWMTFIKWHGPDQSIIFWSPSCMTIWKWIIASADFFTYLFTNVHNIQNFNVGFLLGKNEHEFNWALYNVHLAGRKLIVMIPHGG